MEFSRTIEIKFNWWCEDKNIKEVDFQVQDQLEGHAEQRIFQMRQEGYTSGELLEKINSVPYKGWFEINYV